jgi:hypothetical protein
VPAAAAFSEHTTPLLALNGVATGLAGAPMAGAFVSGAAQVASTPEPSSMLLIGTGLAMAARALRRRRR